MSLFLGKSDVKWFAFTFIYAISEIFHPVFSIFILGLGRGAWLLNAKWHVLDIRTVMRLEEKQSWISVLSPNYDYLFRLVIQLWFYMHFRKLRVVQWCVSHFDICRSYTEFLFYIFAHFLLIWTYEINYFSLHYKVIHASLW